MKQILTYGSHGRLGNDNCNYVIKINSYGNRHGIRTANYKFSINWMYFSKAWLCRVTMFPSMVVVTTNNYWVVS